jgi:hypothetical protein
MRLRRIGGTGDDWWRWARRWGAATLLVALVTACGRKPSASAVDSGASGAPAAAVPTDTAGDRGTTETPAACPMVGEWRPCSVEERVARAGIDLKRETEPVHHDFMHVPGIVYTTSRSRIEVFLYPDSMARARDTDALDSATVSPRGTRVVWKEPATLVMSNNLAAIIITFNERQAERIALALEAGLSAAPGR